MNRLPSTEPDDDKPRLLSLYFYCIFRGEEGRAAEVLKEMRRRGLFNASTLLGILKSLSEQRGREHITKGEVYDLLDEIERKAETENETRGNN